MARITIRGITKKYGALDILKGIDLDIADGEFLTLVGLTALVVGGEHGLRRFSQIVGSLSTETPLKTLEEELAEIDAVTPERVAEYLERFPLDRDPALVALGPLSSI